jgi:LPS sulfotransferase NodH
MKCIPCPFFIAFAARSGSSHLVSLLKSHPDIYCHFEVFNDKRRFEEHDSLSFLNAKSVYQFLDMLFTRKKQAAGFKFQYPRQFSLYPDVLSYLLEKKREIRMICLYRKNILKQAISLQAMHLLRKKHNLCNIKKDAGDVRLPSMITVDIAKLLQRLHRLQDTRNKLLALRSMFDHVYTLSYEDLFYDEKKTCAHILDFLQVKNPLPLSTSMQKIVNDDLKKSVKNYPELCLAIKDTPFEQYLFSICPSLSHT